jgi:hypothetical protein
MAAMPVSTLPAAAASPVSTAATARSHAHVTTPAATVTHMPAATVAAHMETGAAGCLGLGLGEARRRRGQRHCERNDSRG